MEVAAIGDVLLQARGALGEIDKVDADLRHITLAIENVTDERPVGGEIPEVLDAQLRAQYTTSAERLIHDAFFSNASPLPPHGDWASFDNVSIF